MIALLMLKGPATAATLHSDTFPPGSPPQWSGGSSPSLQSGGGPDGEGDGYLQISSAQSNFATHNSTAAWIGDYSEIGATALRVDMRNLVQSEPLAMRVVLFGPGQSTSNRFTSAEPVEVPNDGVWRTYTFSLGEASLVRALGSADYTSVLGNIGRIMFRHDPGAPTATGTPVSAVLGLDNIALVGAVAGDYNGDFLVDASDFQAWKAAFGSSDTASDGNRDGLVDAADYTIWRDNFSAASATAAATSSLATARVPEPATSLLGVAAASILCISTRRSFPSHLTL